MAIISYKLLKPEKITGIDISETDVKPWKEKVEKEGLTHSLSYRRGIARQ
jgi:hypothetical protein